MKKFLSLFLSVIMILSVIPIIPAFADSVFNGYYDMEFFETSDGNIKAKLYIKNMAGFESTNLEIAYDSNVINCIGTTSKDSDLLEHNIKGDVQFTVIFNKDIKGLIKCGMYITQDAITEDFEKADSFMFQTLTFAVKDRAALKNTKFTISAKVNMAEIPDRVIAFKLSDNENTKPPVAPEDPLLIYMGDVDSDGKITSADARTVLRASVNLEPLSDSVLPYANADFDGNITASDARSILRWSVNLDKDSVSKHKFELVSSYKSTCTKPGKYTYTLETGKEMVISGPKAPHKYAPATCTSPRKCVICGATQGSVAEHRLNSFGKCTECGYTDKTVTSAKFISLLKEHGNHYDDVYEYGIKSTDTINTYYRYVQDTGHLQIIILDFSSYAAKFFYSMDFDRNMNIVSANAKSYRNNELCYDATYSIDKAKLHTSTNAITILTEFDASNGIISSSIAQYADSLYSLAIINLDYILARYYDGQVRVRDFGFTSIRAAL